MAEPVELTPADFADAAASALKAHAAVRSGSDVAAAPPSEEALVTALIVDLMRYADRMGLRFSEAIRQAHEQYVAQSEGLTLRVPVKAGPRFPGTRQQPNLDVGGVGLALIALIAYDRRTSHSRLNHVDLMVEREVGEDTLVSLLADLHHYTDQCGLFFDTNDCAPEVESVLARAKAEFVRQSAADGVAYHVGDLAQISGTSLENRIGTVNDGHPRRGWVAAVSGGGIDPPHYQIRFPGREDGIWFGNRDLTRAPDFPGVTIGDQAIDTPAAAERYLLAARSRLAVGIGDRTERTADQAAVTVLSGALTGWGGGTDDHLMGGIDTQITVTRLFAHPVAVAATDTRDTGPAPRRGTGSASTRSTNTSKLSSPGRGRS